jgi:hypothetical protein
MNNTHPLTLRLVGFRGKRLQYLVGRQGTEFPTDSATAAALSTIMYYKGPNMIKGAKALVDSAFFLHLATFMHHCMKNILHN